MKITERQKLIISILILFIFFGMLSITAMAAEEPVSATIRVEGPCSTLLQDTQVNVTSGASLLTGLQQAVGESNVETNNGFLTTIKGYPAAEDPFGYWMYYCTTSDAANGVASDIVKNGATYVFYYQTYDATSYQATASYVKFSTYRKYIKNSESFPLILYKQTYDASWNLVSEPLSGAEIIASDSEGNKVVTGFTAEEENTSGTYNISFANFGTYYLTAYTGNSESETNITRPYCKVIVSEDSTEPVVVDPDSESDIPPSSENEISEEEIDSLLENIAKKYYQSVSSYWDVVAVQAYEKYCPENVYRYTAELKQQFINNAISTMSQNSPTDATLAMNIIALKALGIDSGNLVTLNKQAFDAATALRSSASTGSNGDSYRLIAYQQDSAYASSDQIKTAIDSLLLYQNSTSGFFTSFGYEDADATAIAIAAMAAYYPQEGETDDYGVKQSIDKAFAYLRSVQGENGGISSWGTENANSTSMAVIAYSAMGIDPESIKNATSQASLIDGLVQFRTPENDGFVWSSSYSGDGSQTYQGLLALIAAETITASTGAFNVFDFSSAASEQGVTTASGEAGNDDTGTDYNAPVLEDETVTVSFTLKDVSSAFNGYSVTINSDSTLKDVFKKVMAEKGISYTLTGGVYVTTIDGLSEFDGGIESGWMYTINGEHPSAGIAGYIVKDGDNIIFHFTKDYTQEEDAERWKASSGSEIVNNTKVILTAVTNSKTAAESVSLSSSELKSLNNEKTTLTVETSFGSLNFDPKTISIIESAAGTEKINISVELVDKAKLPEATQVVVGNRPVYNYSVMAGDRYISNFGTGIVKISMPYILQPGEDENAVIACYITDAGELDTVRGAYNAKTKTLDFSVSHFSSFAVGYKEVNFIDVESSDWYKNAVTFVAARGIANGTGENSFEPQRPMTRGQLIVMMMRAFGIEAEINTTDNFADAGDTYYTNYLAAAKSLGITKGTGNNMVMPEAVVSRQDMLVMLYRTMEILEELSYSETDNNISAYSDVTLISDYALNPLNYFVTNGLVSGNAGKLNPLTETSRAQTVQVLFRLLAGDVSEISSSTAALSIEKEIEDCSEYILKAVKSPQVSMVGGEWSVIGLARSGYETPQSWYDSYYAALESYIKINKGVLHEKKYSEYSRVILALTAIGKAPTNVAGYNLLENIADYNKVIWQGINGSIFALIALDSADYEIPISENAQIQTTRELLIDSIISKQSSDGGFSLDGVTADPDITTMALQALAKYKDRKDINSAIEKALIYLSVKQNSNGGYSNRGSENSESVVQALVALTALKIDPENDSRFIKNGNSLIDNLMTYKVSNGGFRHTLEDTEADAMASEQCLYGLAAYSRFLNRENSLYDMIDVESSEPVKGNTDSGIRPNIQVALQGIINQIGESTFEADKTMTRAEFAEVMVKALEFSSAEDLYSNSIILNTPEIQAIEAEEITREQTAVIVTRAAKYCGINVEMSDNEIRDMLAQFPDYLSSAEWARESLAFCYKYNILPQTALNIEPKGKMTQNEIADMIYEMLIVTERI